MILKFLDSDGYNEITTKKLSSITAGEGGIKKFFIQNNLSRALESGLLGQFLQFSDSDMYTMMKWALCPDTLSCPFNVEAELQAGGSLEVDTTYYYHIEAYNELGETAGSLEVSALTDDTNMSIKLTWGKVEGAAGYTIYRSANGIWTNCRRDVIEDPDILEWIDTGQIADPSSPYGWPGVNEDFDLPEENTTAGEAPDYGIPPTLNEGDLSILTELGIGEQKAIWCETDAPLSAQEKDNPRNVIIKFSEVS